MSFDSVAKALEGVIPNSIAIDLDGTLAEYTTWKGIEYIGDPIVPVVNKLKKIKKRKPNINIIVHTARITDLRNDEINDKALSYVVAWLEKHNIPYDSVWVGKGKPLANVYVDDLAVNVTDWVKEDD